MLRLFILSSLFALTYSLFGADSDGLSRFGPEVGPCTINNEKGIKCTEHGFYETVQCDDESCYCVDADTGAKAYDTVTTSNRIMPKCGACLTEKKRQFANGQPDSNAYIPICDTDRGDYQLEQCDSQGKNCFCVDKLTGMQIPNTKQPRNSDKPLNCSGKIPLFGGLPRLPTVAVKPVGLAHGMSGKRLSLRVPVGSPKCALPKEAGTRCKDGNPMVKWYFDADTFQCLAFEYQGCGGSDNRFHTKKICYQTCVMPDYQSCALNEPPFKDANGKVLHCGSEKKVDASVAKELKLKEDGCPPDFKCNVGGFMSYCCNSKTQDNLNQALRPKCANGKKPFQDGNRYADVRFGKVCADNFCPPQHTCETNMFFAYCCPQI